MRSLSELMESGVLELYVLGAASSEEIQLVDEMAAAHPEVRNELLQISATLEQYAQTSAVKPRASVKALLMATIDYLERMKKGELPESPPELTANSRISDFEKWLNRADAVLPAHADDIYAKLIGYTPSATTAIVWLKTQSDNEVHDDEYERFLIVEGTCCITAGDETHALAAGDFFAVPLHTPHQLIVTSAIPCKAILQRLSVA